MSRSSGATRRTGARSGGRPPGGERHPGPPRAPRAARGGCAPVQMGEVAEAAGVALGTLYRYFPSKIHLLVAT
ncbi:helix-turn-helix domain-containing protein, partial [Streptomyces gardneri]|uniref:helix-turn-helix domain-containing protein n=1 Tax=Streptomyces gardneri TaxID=66892 RepID=UPI00369EB212